jgi:hypothetical protein
MQLRSGARKTAKSGEIRAECIPDLGRLWYNVDVNERETIQSSAYIHL